MYISLNWLKDFISLPAKISPGDLAAALTKHTVEVENVVNQAEGFSGVVVAKVLEVSSHPNADRLKITKVDTGKEELVIVCGAPNVEAGQMVPVATVGTVLPGGLEIKEAEIRGVKSHGMICAEDELGLGKEHAGIMVLNKKAKTGDALSKYLRAEDNVLEIDNKSLSNRPDLLSHYGLAREISVIFNLSMKPYEKMLDKTDFSKVTDSLTIKNDNKEACRRYQAIRIDNIKVEESPEWLKERLVAIGQRPINNIVDLTNYVMFEVGQPLHAFDASKINKIIIRSALKNEKFTTLDSQEHIVDEEDLVIATADEPVALAGIMGGLESGVNQDTTTIVLEAANFLSSKIRKTSQKLGLRSESSVRFEKSLDPNMTELATRRFLLLLKKVCPTMSITSSLADLGGPVVEVLSVNLEFDWLHKKLGVQISEEKIINILSRLGFSIVTKDGSGLTVAVPSWRSTKDISTKEDLAEEILRFYGYDNVVSSLPVQELVLPDVNQGRRLARRLKDFLALKHSLNEAENYSFVGEDLLTKLGIDFSHHLKLANPVSEVYSLLRRSLVPGLMVNIKNNQAKSNKLGFFEIGNVFFDMPGSIKKEKQGDEQLPYQETMLCVALAGENNEVFSSAKGIINSTLEYVLGSSVRLSYVLSDDFPGWVDASAAAKIMIGSKEVGTIALVSQAALSGLNIKKVVAVAEINFHLLSDLEVASGGIKWQESPKYPSVFRDVAIVVKENIMYNDLQEEIVKSCSLIKSVDLFDIYLGDKLEVGVKSLAFHLEFQSPDRTLTTAEVDKAEKELMSALHNKFEAKLREF